MKRRSKWAIGAVAGLLLVATAAMVAIQGPWVERMVIQSLRESTGLEIGLDDVRINLSGPSVTLMGLTIFNPPGFEAGEALRFKEVHAVAGYGALLRQEPLLKKLVLDMPHLVVVRNPQGEYNWQRIGREVQTRAKAAKTATSPAARPTSSPPPSEPPSQPPAQPPTYPRQTDSPTPQPVPAPSAKPKEPEWSIDELTVRIQSIELRDYRKSSSPTPRRMDLGFEHTATNVTDIQTVGTEIGTKLLARAAPLLLMGVLDAAADSEAGRNLSTSLQKGVERLFRKIERTPAITTNLTPDRIDGALQR